MTQTTTQTSTQPDAQADPKRYQCRHIHADGHRCGSPSLRRQTFCYYHHTTRKPIPRGDLRQRYADQSHGTPFDLPAPEDRTSIQLSIGEILRRIAAQQLDAKRAGLLLYGLQIASSNLPPHPRPAAEEATKPHQTVEEVVEDDVYGPLAPEAEFNATPGARKSLDVILMEQWAKDKEEWTTEQEAPSRHPVWTDEGEDGYGIQTLPQIQAVAEGCPMITASAAQRLSWGPSLPKPTTAHPTRKPTKKIVITHSLSSQRLPSYPALLSFIPVIPCSTRPSHPSRQRFLSYAFLFSSISVLPRSCFCSRSCPSQHPPQPQRHISARQYSLCLRRNHPRPFTCPPSGNRTQPHGSHGRTILRTGPANSSPSPGFTPKSFATSPA